MFGRWEYLRMTIFSELGVVFFCPAVLLLIVGVGVFVLFGSKVLGLLGGIAAVVIGLLWLGFFLLTTEHFRRQANEDVQAVGAPDRIMDSFLNLVEQQGERG